MNEKKHPITPELLDRFFDNDLSNDEAEALAEALAKDASLAAQLDEKQALHDLVSSHLLQAAEEVDFSGFEHRLFARIDAEKAVQRAVPADPKTGPWQWLKTWFAAGPWAFAAPLGAAAAVALFLLWPAGPVAVDDPGTANSAAANNGAGIVAVADPIAGDSVEIDDLETGSRLAMVYNLPDTQTTVIWISDADDEDSQQGSL